MLQVHCPRHGADVLVGAHGITAIENRPTGIVVRWRCTCGHRGSTLTGRGGPRRGHPLDAAA